MVLQYSVFQTTSSPTSQPTALISSSSISPTSQPTALIINPSISPTSQPLSPTVQPSSSPVTAYQLSWTAETGTSSTDAGLGVTASADGQYVYTTGYAAGSLNSQPWAGNRKIRAKMYDYECLEWLTIAVAVW